MAELMTVGDPQVVDTCERKREALCCCVGGYRCESRSPLCTRSFAGSIKRDEKKRRVKMERVPNTITWVNVR